MAVMQYATVVFSLPSFGRVSSGLTQVGQLCFELLFKKLSSYHEATESSLSQTLKIMEKIGHDDPCAGSGRNYKKW